MKSFRFAFLVFFVFYILESFVSCGKIYASKKNGKVGDAGQANIRKVDNIESTSVNDEKIQKINRVIESLGKRAQEGIKIFDYDEFLLDLENILRFDLESTKVDSSKNDLPLLYLVDKKHSLSSLYEPVNLNRNDLSLRKEAYDGLLALSNAALKDGIKLLVSSTYRSYSYQERLFQHWVKVDGLEEAERESARAGMSQHQLGTAVDFGSITDDFAKTKMGKWIYENAADYGWSLSFPENYEDVTGYRFECWHFRYIGKDACDFQKKYFDNVQQFMLEFIHEWNNQDNGAV